jgi:ABC-type antimicrobial peptide transport system permease subunit
VIGELPGGLAFWVAAVAAEASPVPLWMPPEVLVLVLGSQALATIAAGFWVLRKLRRIDPAAVFQS